jgi:hypothetical protein
MENLLRFLIRLGVLFSSGLLVVVCCAESPDQSFISVRQYGAKGDGATDDSRAIQAALDAADPGGTVYFPATSRSYYTATCLQPKAHTTLLGDGPKSEISVPSAGWLLVPSTCYGIINLNHVEGVRITGLRIVGTVQALDSNHTPKLIYIESVDKVEIDHDDLANTAFEGIWVGGNLASTRVTVSNNSFTHVGYGGANKTQGLPAIQCNWRDGVISNNSLSDVGTGIACSQTNDTITGNTVDQFSNQGIAIGDGRDNGPFIVSGNTVVFAVMHADGSPQVGYFAGSGVIGTEHLNNFSGNTCSMIGTTAGVPAGICYLANSPHAVFDSNTAEVVNVGLGFLVYGRVGGSDVTLSNNTCDVVNESARTECFVGKPNGGRNALTLFSHGNKAYGNSRTNGSFAFDYNTVGGGDLNASASGDLANDGLIRIGGSVYNSDGKFDHIPFIISSQSISSVEQSISFTGEPYSSLGSQADGTVTFCRDCQSSGEGESCAPSGNGKLAAKINGVWKCF